MNYEALAEAYRQAMAFRAWWFEAEEAGLTQEDIKSLIDLALMTGDRNWFIELTNKLKGAAV